MNLDNSPDELDSLTFVSYARADSAFVLKLATDLKKAGALVWLDQMDINPGQRWDRSIEDALRRSRRMIVVLSPAAVDSNNVMDEVSFALEEGKTVIPIICVECTVPFRLRRLQYLDFCVSYQAALTSLIKALGIGPTRGEMDESKSFAAAARAEVRPPVGEPTQVEKESNATAGEPMEDRQDTSVVLEKTLTRADSSSVAKPEVMEFGRLEKNSGATPRQFIGEGQDALAISDKFQTVTNAPEAATSALGVRDAPGSAEQQRLDLDLAKSAEEAEQLTLRRWEGERLAGEDAAQAQRHEAEDREKLSAIDQKLAQPSAEELDFEPRERLSSSVDIQEQTKAAYLERNAKPGRPTLPLLVMAMLVCIAVVITVFFVNSRPTVNTLREDGTESQKGGSNSGATPIATSSQHPPTVANQSTIPRAAKQMPPSQQLASKKSRQPIHNAQRDSSEQSTPQGPTRLGGAVAESNLLKQVQPVYPPLAKSARVSGTVIFEVIISKEGDVESLQLISGHPLLVNAAKEAVLQWKYRPPIVDGRPVEVVTSVVVNFVLQQ